MVVQIDANTLLEIKRNIEHFSWDSHLKALREDFGFALEGSESLDLLLPFFLHRLSEKMLLAQGLLHLVKKEQPSALVLVVDEFSLNFKTTDWIIEIAQLLSIPFSIRFQCN